jgi:hypothetical protein
MSQADKPLPLLSKPLPLETKPLPLVTKHLPLVTEALPLLTKLLPLLTEAMLFEQMSKAISAQKKSGAEGANVQLSGGSAGF